jgi:uncharacterized protein YdaU (DUF1376 family)
VFEAERDSVLPGMFGSISAARQTHRAEGRDLMKKSVRLPYLPWYDGDFLRSTQGWSPMEKFVLWRLLCSQWESGPLPASPFRLAAIVGITQVEFDALWGQVGKKFEQTETGLVNPRMEAHREKYLAYRDKQSEDGKKGATKRWKKSQGASNVVPIAGHDKVVV